MSDHRLALIAAGSARSAVEAREAVAAMCVGPRGRPSGPIREALGVLSASGADAFQVGPAGGAGGAVLTTQSPAHRLLGALLMLAGERGLAVYDITLARLYDPAGAVVIDVVIPGLRIPFLTRDLLDDLVSRPEWPDPNGPYVVIERSSQNYIQAWRNGDGSYLLEYREGGPESHFEYWSSDAATVTEVMWSWATGTSAWRAAVDWLFLDLAASPPDVGAAPPAHSSSDSIACRSV